MMKIKTFAGLTLLLLGLSACGGGGGAAVVAPVDSYLGTWSGCADAEKMTVSVTQAGIDILHVSLEQEFFTDANCSGDPVGTASFQSPTFQLTHQNTETITLEDPLTYPVSLLGPHQVDVFEAAAPAGSITLTGAVDENNCFNGTGVCFDQLSYPSSNKSVALQLEGDVLTPINFMSAVNPGAGKWYADEIVWTRVN